MISAMNQPRPLLLENLARYKREADVARERYERQLAACIEAGRGTYEIAEAIGITPQAVSMRRRKMRGAC